MQGFSFRILRTFVWVKTRLQLENNQDSLVGETDLALSQGHSEELGIHATLHSQLAQDLGGVHPSRQHKDEGRQGGGVP